MAQVWGNNEGFGGSEYLQDEYSDAMFDSIEGYNETQTNADYYFGPTPPDERGRQDSGYYSPEQKLLEYMDNNALRGMYSSSTAIAPGFVNHQQGLINTQQGFPSKYPNTLDSSNSPNQISDSSLSFINNTNSNANYTAIDIPENNQAKEHEQDDVPKPKARRTRKRKTSTPQEQARKQSAFLERNRLAAKKCRAKRKEQQDQTSEGVRKLSHINSALKAALLDLQTTKDDCMKQIQAIKDCPGVEEELMAIEAHRPLRPSAFFWHECGLRPKSEMPLGYTLPVDPLLEDPPFPYLKFPGPFSRGTEMSRGNSVESEFSQQSTPAPQKRSDVARQPHHIDTTVNQNNEQISSSSITLTGISDSHNSARDSGLGNMTPITPNTEFPLFKDEGMMAHSPEPSMEGEIPINEIDPALLGDSFFFEQLYQGSQPTSFDPYLQHNSSGGELAFGA